MIRIWIGRAIWWFIRGALLDERRRAAIKGVDYGTGWGSRFRTSEAEQRLKWHGAAAVNSEYVERWK